MRARITRGKTKVGRLDALDQILLKLDPPPSAPGPTPSSPLAWDLGFGAHPHTTLAWWDALTKAGWPASVLGIEAHAGRAAFAAKHNRRQCRFVHLDDPRPAPWDQAPRWIRAMNVLRQYRAEESEHWHHRWHAALAPNGHLIEGTCSADGSVLVAHWIRKGPTQPLRHGLLFYTSFAQGFAPLLFGDRLPKDLRAHARQQGAVGDFFGRWTTHWEPFRSQGPQASFMHSVASMQETQPGLLAWRQGPGAVLVWTPPGGIPMQS